MLFSIIKPPQRSFSFLTHTHTWTSLHITASIQIGQFALMMSRLLLSWANLSLSLSHFWPLLEGHAY